MNTSKPLAKACLTLCLMVFAQIAYAASTGDFAPLQTGDIWKYTGSYTCRSLYYGPRNDSLTRTIQVVRQEPGKSLFDIQIRDSIYDRNHSSDEYHSAGTDIDTIIVDTGVLFSSSDSIGVYSGFSSQFNDWYDESWFDSAYVPEYWSRPKWFFAHHLASDSSIIGSLSVAGQTYSLDSIKLPAESNISLGGKGRYAQNIGLFDLAGSYTVGTNTSPACGFSFQLEEFNGQPMLNYAIVGVLIESKKSLKLGQASHLPFSLETILETNRNALGRTSILRNHLINK